MKHSLQRILALLISTFLLGFASVPAQADVDLQQLEEQAMKAAVRKVASSVVQIETFGGLEQVDGLLVGSGPTTGLVVSEDGYIVSSAFNFVQRPTSILVTLPGGQRAGAQIVARDHSRMLVLLKVETDEPLVVPEVVPRDEMQVGQWTIAVGRTFDPAQANLSVGLLSATNRIWSKALQTDAKVSPSNYGGPLVDIRGRVLGVLVPLSPEGQGEVAGAEWYDSGIGFAIPLADLLSRLEDLKQGQDLHPGVLGVSLKGRDLYGQPAVVAAARVNSPAAKAGLEADDRIIEIEGQAIERPAHLRHALGTRYAGEQIAMVVLRGEERIETVVELAEKLEPYAHPFLGLLPLRDTPGQQGVTVRYVYPGSGADEAGLLPDDRIVAVDDQQVADAAALRDSLVAHPPQHEVTVRIRRGEDSQELQVRLGTLPTAIPDSLPAARRPQDEPDDDEQGDDEQGPAVGRIEIKIPEEANECIAYVPETYRPDLPHGVLLWLHAPGQADADQLIGRWKTHCEQHDLILLAPQSADPARWEALEAAFVRKTLDHLLAGYNVDPSRIVIHGYQGGGAMAYLVGFSHRELVRAIAVVDAPLPARASAPDNDPVYPMALYSASAKSAKLADQIEATVRRLQTMKYPVTTKPIGGQPRYLNDQELEELVRWIDTLDRI